MRKPGTKAETLESLASTLTTAKVLPLFYFTAEDWRKNPSSVTAKIKSLGWSGLPLIVRSSSLAEDSKSESLAGKYKSIGNVLGESAIAQAVSEVIASYEGANPKNQVLIQPMLLNAKLSGVAFSRDMSSGAPYCIINYDDTSGKTDSITSGNTAQAKTFYYSKVAKGSAPADLKKVLDLLNELEGIFKEPVDVEFALTEKDELYLFQARPIAAEMDACDETSHRKNLGDIYLKIKRWNSRHPYLFGERTVFGIMPDWNPAEIVGVRPRPLALSLYREVITDSIWAYQRNNYGYMNLRSFPLILDLAGLPYVDVRLSFNSFIPGTLNPELAEKLANFYLDKLVATPSSHDRVEFDIVYSCYTFDIDARSQELLQYGFSEADRLELVTRLRDLTNRIISRDGGLWKQDIEKVERLEERRKTILESNLDTVSKIYWLLEDCRRYGTLPFAGLARAAFIAVQMLKSLVAVGAFSGKEYEEFLNSLHTISSEMGWDFRNLPKEKFLEKYGHLRPGTYDIRSPRYDESPQTYFNWTTSGEQSEPKMAQFSLPLDRMCAIESLLEKHSIDHDVLSLFEFLKAAIEGRESAKFVFTRSLSDALVLFKQLGVENGLDAEECSYASIDCIRELYGSTRDPRAVLLKSIQAGKESAQAAKQINLPPLITSPEDVWSFFLPQSDPNYITQRKTSGSVICFPIAEEQAQQIKKKVVFIPSADPGYDWIFSHDILGFVTMYGGANSHMAIRAAEQGVPAVIGAGPALYSEWSKADFLEIDCEQRQVKVIR